MDSEALTHQIRWETLLAEVAAAMNDPSASYALDLETYEVVPLASDVRLSPPVSLDEEEEELDVFPEWVQESGPASVMESHEPDRFLHIQRDKTAELLKVVNRFIETIHPASDRHDLERALEQDKPYYSFLRELSYHAFFHSRWEDFKNEIYREKAEAWLKSKGITQPRAVSDSELS
ncbi:UPF0158 family protein [Pontibacter sp. G13]|uniref:UPF0158 family protein n=1 Tax=Pontibacter sp. G13 TaxID=3074898 RepID=UPI00288C5D35|nr:UPF0158 family protein [Pontibacter sp. G13]WNJ19925.1 UPF0158 family protein [Pontibacter sp. G13]